MADRADHGCCVAVSHSGQRDGRKSTVSTDHDAWPMPGQAAGLPEIEDAGTRIATPSPTMCLRRVSSPARPARAPPAFV
jgi:hypothetical protein